MTDNVPGLKIVFRVDASLRIGTGHVMRCLTLADTLRARGAGCQFMCIEHPGNLIGHIRGKGFAVHAMPVAATPEIPQRPYANWLGTTQENDAANCAAILAGLQPDWLIVDHYALSADWENALRPHYRKLLVIDDLADRPHRCELLLDQTFGRSAEDYRHWVSAGCELLCGSQYALLRPEFAALRPGSLQRRANPQLQRLLVSMGGVDGDNASGQILDALPFCGLPDNCQITLVLGATAPWLAEVRQQAMHMPWPTDIQVNVKNMAQLMAESDLAIGAPGTTSWERCCLGLPAVIVVLADNQRLVAQGLEQAGAACVLTGPDQILAQLPPMLTALVLSPARRIAMALAAARITDGHGVATVIRHLEQ